MRIAIIGGGSAGLVTAHLLDGVHQVTLFEKASILGGHVRTLNRNVECDLEPELILDAGVIEFERRNARKGFKLVFSIPSQVARARSGCAVAS
jgi:predicted NAD/FAD-binding protein